MRATRARKLKILAPQGRYALHVRKRLHYAVLKRARCARERKVLARHGNGALCTSQDRSDTEAASARELTILAPQGGYAVHVRNASTTKSSSARGERENFFAPAE